MMVRAAATVTADMIEGNVLGNDPACFRLIGSEGAIENTLIKVQ